MNRSIIVDTAYAAIQEIVEMVECYANVEESMAVGDMLAAAKVRLDKIQAHPQDRPHT